MKRMADLHVLMDEAAETYGIPESEFLKDWRRDLKAERDWRMQVYASSLEEPGQAVELLEKHRGNAFELLTLLAYDFGKYSEDVYTAAEREVIAAVYEEVCRCSGTCVVSVPKWFIPRHEITERNGDLLWQNVNVKTAAASGGEACVYQTAIWSELNHPHVTRLLGACHVGYPAFFVVEEADEITQNVLRRLPAPGVSANLRATNTPHKSIWELLLGIALGLQYLHERGDCVRWSCSRQVIGEYDQQYGKLVGWRSGTAWSRSSSCGLSILTILHDIATAEDVSAWSWCTPQMIKTLPERPSYVEDDFVWHLLSKMCVADPAERVDMKYVVQQLQSVVNGASILPENQFDSSPGTDNGRRDLQASTLNKRADSGPDQASESDSDGDFSDCDSDFFSKSPTSKPEAVLKRLTELTELGVFGGSSGDGSSELVFVATVDEYEHPDFQRTIKELMKEIEERLDDIECPASPMDRHVYERLASIHAYLQSLSQCRQDLLQVVIALASSCKWSLADRVDSTNLASRTIVSRGIGHRSLAFHHSIDHLLVRFDLPEAASHIHSWKHRWDWDHLTELNDFDTMLQDPEYFAGLRDEEERIEVATLLAFEIDRRRVIYSADTLDAMTRAIQGLSGDAAIPVLPRWHVPWHEIDVRGYISSGSFGSVHCGKWFEADVAVKLLFQADKADFFHEIDVWFSLNHPNVVKLFGACHVGTPFFLCEYAENGTLPQFARDQKWQDWIPGYSLFGRPRNPVWAALYNAAKGLQHLHQRGVIHGDLMGNNILVGADRKAKLTDFGLSVFAQNLNPQAAEPVGAVRWKAPERLGKVDSGPSFKSDIFSFGMFIVELLSGQLPWINIGLDAGVRQEVLRGKLPHRPPQFADDEWNLARRMYCFDPSERIDSFSVVMTLRSYVGRLA